MRDATAKDDKVLSEIQRGSSVEIMYRGRKRGTVYETSGYAVVVDILLKHGGARRVVVGIDKVVRVLGQAVA